MKVDDILKEASKLPEGERASIASQLFHGLESAHHWVSDEEVQERISEAEADPSVLLTLEEFTSGIERRGS